jgi:hypothetical protein
VARQVAVEPMVERWRVLRAGTERAEAERADLEPGELAPPPAEGLWRRLAARLGRRG